LKFKECRQYVIDGI
jgi:hypothetical protein